MKLQQSLHKTIINLLWNSLMQAQIYPFLRATKIHNVFQLTIQKMIKIQLSNATFVVLIKSIIFVEKKMGTKVPIRARNLDFLKCFLNLFVL